MVKEIPCLCGQESELSKSIRGNDNISDRCKICYGVRLDKLKLKIADMGLARTLSTDKYVMRIFMFTLEFTHA